MAQNDEFRNLLAVADDKRDRDWENQFLTLLPQQPLNLLNESPQTGPDSWPYLFTETSEEAQEPAHQVLHWLSDRGIGLVVNPQKEYPDYVLSYGMVWSSREFSNFFGPTKTTKVEEIGAPSEQLLPNYVRKILKQFFLDQGVFQPKLLVAPKDDSWELGFSIESLGNPPEEEFEGILEAISWFLPPNYQLALVNEKGGSLPPFATL